MPRKTILDDNAEIYQIRKQKTEKEKLRELPPKERFHYLWEYYRFHALGVIAGIALIIYVIYQIVTPKVEIKFYAAWISNTINDDIIEEVQTDFGKHLQLDPELEEVIFNTSLYLSSSSDYEVNSRLALNTYVAASEVDVMIAPESQFKGYAHNGFMDDLSDQLPTDLYSSLTDDFFISDTEEDPKKSVYGIYLTDTELFRDHAVTDPSDPYVLGIIANGKHKENSIEFLRYLFKLYP